MDVVRTIEMRPYRKLFLNYFVLSCAIVIISYWMAQNSFYLGWHDTSSTMIKNILLYGMIAVSIVYSLYLKSQKTKLNNQIDFDEKKKFHEKYFRIRMAWYVGSSFISCILFLLVANWFFFYFALFELLLLLIVYPTKFFFKKEFGDDDIVFI